MVERNRYHYFLLFLMTIAAGLFSRTSYIPEIIYPYIGDALYAVMIYFLIGCCLARLSSLGVLLFTIAICFTIEMSQLLNVGWLNTIRQTIPGKLVLGQGFLWSDLIAYTFGALIGFLLESFLLRNTKAIHHKNP